MLFDSNPTQRRTAGCSEIASRFLYSPPDLGNWWKCSECGREVNKDLHGAEKCPDCAHKKGSCCTDPCPRPGLMDDKVRSVFIVDGGCSAMVTDIDNTHKSDAGSSDSNFDLPGASKCGKPSIGSSARSMFHLE